MNEWSGKFVRTEQSQWGPKVVFSSQKGEWKPMDVGPNVDLAGLEAGQYYKVYTEKNDKGFSYLVRFEKSEQRQGGWRGGGRGYEPLNFVSNVVGQAIAVGVLKAPEQVAAWAKAAWAVTKEPSDG